MRHQQADEADRARGGDQDTGQQAGDHEEFAAQPVGGEAEAGRGLVAEDECVQGAGAGLQGDQAERHGGGGQGERVPGGAAEAAHQPEQHAAGLLFVAGPEHQVAADPGEELADGDAGQHQSQRGEAAAAPGGEPDQGEGAERAGERGGAGPESEGAARAEAEDGRGDRAERGAGGDAEQVRVGERVADQGLHGGADQAESGADQCGEQGARDA